MFPWVHGLRRKGPRQRPVVVVTFSNLFFTVLLSLPRSLVTTALSASSPCTTDQRRLPRLWPEQLLLQKLRTTACVDAKLRGIPRYLSHDMEVFNASGSELSVIHQSMFEHYSRLVALFLCNSQISTVTDAAFRKMSNLEILSLKGNWILFQVSHFSPRVFVPLRMLRYLDLSKNTISTIPGKFFRYLKSIEVIDLSGNQITRVLPFAFKGPRSLLSLDLSNTRLETLDRSFVGDNVNLVRLNLASNLWRCDCKLRWLKIWYAEIRNSSRRVELTKYTHKHGATCQTPKRLSGKAVFSTLTDINDFACSPKVLDAPASISVFSGSNASLSCYIESIPRASILWYHNRVRVQPHWPRVHLWTTTGTNFVAHLHISAVHQQDAGQWSCRIKNRAASASHNITLVVLTAEDDAGWSLRKIAIMMSILAATIVLLLVILATCYYFFSTRANFGMFKLDKLINHTADTVDEAAANSNNIHLSNLGGGEDCCGDYNSQRHTLLGSKAAYSEQRLLDDECSAATKSYMSPDLRRVQGMTGCGSPQGGLDDISWVAPSPSSLRSYTTILQRNDNCPLHGTTLNGGGLRADCPVHRECNSRHGTPNLSGRCGNQRAAVDIDRGGAALSSYGCHGMHRDESPPLPIVQNGDVAGGAAPRSYLRGPPIDDCIGGVDLIHPPRSATVVQRYIESGDSGTPV